MKKISISTPGKTILHGEHAVVYGKHAIAVSLDLKINVTVTCIEEQKIVLDFPGLDIYHEWKLPTSLNIKFENDDENGIIGATETNVTKCEEFFGYIRNESMISQGISVFLFLYCAITRKYGLCLGKPMCVKVTSELPIGAGLGSSASYAVSLTTAFLTIYHQVDHAEVISDEKLELINKWAYQAEIILHGTPSGIDNSICTYGGALLFKSAKIQAKVSRLPGLEIMLVYSNVQRNTKKLVSHVKELKNKYSSVIDPILEAIESISILQWQNLIEASTNGFSEEILTKICDLVPLNHHLLNSIGVGHEKLNIICNTASNYGFPAKLTGAGGGGCVIIFLKKGENQKASKLKLDLESQGFNTWMTNLAGAGVKFVS